MEDEFVTLHETFLSARDIYAWNSIYNQMIKQISPPLWEPILTKLEKYIPS
jgi:hypothetical protein